LLQHGAPLTGVVLNMENAKVNKEDNGAYGG